MLALAGATACSGNQGTGTGPAAATTGGATAKAATGPKAPDFSLKALDGSTVRLSDYAGKKVVLLDFWATTCDPCLQEMPELVKLYKKYKDRGFEILAISADGPDSLAQVTATVHDKGMIFPVLLDEETSVLPRYNPKRDLPCTVVVDRTGSVVLKRSSYQAGDDSAMKTLEAAIVAALAN
ncbi:MAG: TlpA family protein disulfide reductase [Polyangiaceae bacterium]|nr:TlpA family protein disulfide reductase [Polyangiaceae bacterium]